MGAKNLKAIAVRAAGKIATADPVAVLAAAGIPPRPTAAGRRLRRTRLPLRL
jgi:hypothetical protein